MKNNKTYYHLILDRSGSMTSCIEQTVEGVNQQIRRIKEVSEKLPDQELITSLTLFNHNITKAWTRLRAKDLREITFHDYKPDGTTALLDAIGSAISDLQSAIGPELEKDKASCVIVIITDGYENASKKYSHDRISSIIRELELTGKWTFSYMGATLDAVEIAMRFNIKKSNAMHFDISEISNMHARVCDSISSYMNFKQSGRISNEFIDSEEN